MTMNDQTSRQRLCHYQIIITPCLRAFLYELLLFDTAADWLRSVMLPFRGLRDASAIALRAMRPLALLPAPSASASGSPGVSDSSISDQGVQNREYSSCEPNSARSANVAPSSRPTASSPAQPKKDLLSNFVWKKGVRLIKSFVLSLPLNVPSHHRRISDMSPEPESFLRVTATQCWRSGASAHEVPAAFPL